MSFLTTWELLVSNMYCIDCNELSTFILKKSFENVLLNKECYKGLLY